MPTSRRDQIIEAAAALLDVGGPGAVTLRDVGKAAGVSHNAPYRHFADKADLLAAVAARELALTAHASEPPPQVEALMGNYLAWARRHPERFKLVFGRWSGDHPDLRQAADTARQGLVEAVVRAQAAGRLKQGEPERLAALLLATAHGAADLALAGHLARGGKGDADPEDLLADLFHHLRDDARPPPARAPPPEVNRPSRVPGDSG